MLRFQLLIGAACPGWPPVCMGGGSGDFAKIPQRRSIIHFL